MKDLSKTSKEPVWFFRCKSSCITVMRLSTVTYLVVYFNSPVTEFTDSKFWKGRNYGHCS
jgi:hypothetical protein